MKRTSCLLFVQGHSPSNRAWRHIVKLEALSLLGELMDHVKSFRNGGFLILLALAATFAVAPLAISGEAKDALIFNPTTDDAYPSAERALKRLKLGDTVNNGCESNGSAQVGHLANHCANKSYSAPAVLATPQKKWLMSSIGVRNSMPLMTTTTVVVESCSSKSGMAGIDLSSGQIKWMRPDICPSESPWLNEAKEVGLIARAERTKLETGEWKVTQVSPTSRMIYLDADTGETVREFPLELRSEREIAKDTKPRNPTTYPREFANVLEAGGMLLVPDLDAGRLTAVSAKDGRWLWAYPLYDEDGKRPFGACLSYLSVAHGVLLASSGIGSPLGGKIFALDVATGKELWTKPIATCGTKQAIFEDKAVLITADKLGRQGMSGRQPWEYRLVVANLKTGEPIWKSDSVESEANPPLGWSGKYMTQWFNLNLVSGQGVLVTYSNNRTSALLSYDIDKGDMRWIRTDSSFPLFSTGGIIVGRGVSPERIMALDAYSGTLLWELPIGEGTSQLPAGIGAFSPAPDGSWVGVTPEGVVRLQ